MKGFKTPGTHSNTTENVFENFNFVQMLGKDSKRFFTRRRATRELPAGLLMDLKGHGHWVNSLALNTEDVIRTGPCALPRASWKVAAGEIFCLSLIHI